MATPSPELNPDAVAEIFLRLPPDDPKDLVRASAVCKPWFPNASDPDFLRLYRAFHGKPRLLGFLHNRIQEGTLTRFVPTTAFRPDAAAATHRGCVVLDCRHGRVILYDSASSEFVVWDPVTGRECRISDEVPDVYYTNHAVLCAAGAACDHSTCSGGAFLVACAGVHARASLGGDAYACVYSSETGARSEQAYLRLGYDHCSSLGDRPASFVGGVLYFASYSGDLLRYDVLGGHGLSVIGLRCGNNSIVMTADNGGLGLATFDNDMVSLWSAETDPNGDARWVQTMLINLQELLPVDIRMSAAWLSGFAEDANVIFLSTDDSGIFTIELKSLLTRKVCEMGNVKYVYPFVSFYTPFGFNLTDNNNASSSKDNMPGSPWVADNQQCCSDEKEEEKTDDEPPTKRQKRVPYSDSNKSD